LAKAEELGGTTVMPVTDVPGMGMKIAYFTDPEGHVVGPVEGSGRHVVGVDKRAGRRLKN
jgi:predicted enzyme related to lactoylglutathione lyase